MPPIFIHTSDRMAFKTCRRAWFWASPLGLSLRPQRTSPSYWFGTGIHEALAAYYSNGTTPANNFAYYISAYGKELFSNSELSIEQEEQLHAFLLLGQGMLAHYVSYMNETGADTKYTALGTEIKFVVPILEGVYYAGKIDALFLDEKTGVIWIVEHKTTSQMREDDFYVFDEQCGSYIWALHQICKGRGFIDLDKEALRHKSFGGILYNELRKKVPAEPRILVSGQLSEAKNQDTTHTTYKNYLIRNGYNLDAYKDILAYLKTKPNTFFRRTFVRRNDTEIKALGHQIQIEASDMLQCSIPEHEYVRYPNPGYQAMNCLRCAFVGPCIATNDGIKDYAFSSLDYKSVKIDGEEWLRERIRG